MTKLIVNTRDESIITVRDSVVVDLPDEWGDYEIVNYAREYGVAIPEINVQEAFMAQELAKRGLVSADDMSWGEVAERDSQGFCPSSPNYSEPHISDDEGHCRECGAELTVRAPHVGQRVSTPDGIGSFEGVTSHLYAVILLDGRMRGYAPSDVTIESTEGKSRFYWYGEHVVRDRVNGETVARASNREAAELIVNALNA